MVQAILKDYILTNIEKTSTSDLLNIIRSIYLQDSMISKEFNDVKIVIEKLKIMLNQTVTQLKSLDIHMLTHILIIMKQREQDIFA